MLVLALALGVLMAPARARADEIDDFLAARDAYTSADFVASVRAFRVLVGGDTPALRDPTLRLQARRYYAASLYAQRREDAAGVEVERLLREDPDARLDVVQFDPGFVLFFESRRTRLEPELRRLRAERQEARQREDAARAARRAEVLSLLTRETVVLAAPRWTMFVPFGVGQFANGQSSLGYFFLISELVLGATSVVTFARYESLRPSNAVEASDPAANRERELIRVANIVSVAGFAAAAVAGVLQAVLAHTERVTVRPRPLPPSLRNVEISTLGGRGLVLGLRF